MWCVLWYSGSGSFFFPCSLPPPPPSSTWCGITPVMLLTSMGRILLPYIPKTSCDFTTFSQNRQCRKITATIHSKNISLLLLFSFSKKQSFWEYYGSGTKILNDWCKKMTLRGKCIWYTYKSFMWAMYRDQKKWTILAEKQCKGEQWTEVSLYIFWCSKNGNEDHYVIVEPHVKVSLQRTMFSAY
jgi:hypothetical protein